MTLIAELVELFRSAVKSLVVASPFAFTEKFIGLVTLKTSLSSNVVDQNVLYLKFLLSVEIDSAPTINVCFAEPFKNGTSNSLMRFAENMVLSLSVGSE